MTPQTDSEFRAAVKVEMDAREILAGLTFVNTYGLDYTERLELANHQAVAQATHMAAKQKLEEAIQRKSQRVEP